MDSLTQKWFRSHVERCVAAVLGDEVAEPDDDGDYTFRVDRVLCYVQVVDEPVGGVRVVGLAARLRRRTPALLREINEMTQASPAKVFVNSANIVVVDYHLPAVAVSVEALSDATAHVSKIASELGPVLATTFEGETVFPAEPLTAAG